MDETIYYCALNRIFGFKPDKSRLLLAQRASAEEVFKMTQDELFNILPNDYNERMKVNEKSVEEAASELDTLAKTGIKFIPISSESYPPLLKECPNSPIGIYVRGQLPSIKRDCISIVGTRDISPYGTEWCNRIVQAISRCKERPAIISGFALGTDITAHKAAIENGLPTIGIMASGPENIYPSRHTKFANEICRMDECGLITDYPTATAPLPIHFIRRNRIIAGMSKATIVIESRSRGGSLITATDAFNFNREVYALPGRIDDSRSQGCNWLIRNNMAETIETLDDLIKSLSFCMDRTIKKTFPDIEDIYKGDLGEDEIKDMNRILKTIQEKRGLTNEELSLALGIDIQKISEYIALLECDDFIYADLMGRYMINTKKM